MANPNTAVFPGTLPDDTNLMVATNDAFTELALDITNIQTSGIQVSRAFNTPCLIRIDSEIIYIGSNIGNVYNGAVRAFAGSTATSHTAGTNVFGFVEAHHHNQLSAEVQAIASSLGTGLNNVVQSSDSFGGDVTGTASAVTVAQVGGATASQIAHIVTVFAVVRNEVPTGTINGSNTNFTVTTVALLDSVMVWKNGTLLKPTTDFTVSGSTISLTAAPSGSDWLYVLYRSGT